MVEARDAISTGWERCARRSQDVQDADLFMELAGIAGVFVGFAALIAVRSGGPSDPLEVAPMRMVVSLAMLAIVAALAPVVLGRYDLTDHQVWALSSALAWVGFALMGAVSARTPEYRAGWSTSIAATRLTPSDVVEWAAFALYMIVLLVAPIIIMLGVAPESEAALYFTYVVLILLGAGWALLGLVFAQRQPPGAKAPDTRHD
jgi:hypothetical protein